MASTDWTKATFHRFERTITSSTNVAEVVVHLGDLSLKAYIKAMGNPSGNHVLACEWVASQLARWFGLSTLDFGLMEIEEADEIPLGSGYTAKPGPAFVSKLEPGFSWSGKESALESLLNPEDIARLVVFDTWVLNADRYAPHGMFRRPNFENVFLSERDGITRKYRLLAIDHTHSFTNGSEISARVREISRVKDGRLYGLFPEFERYMTASLAEKAVEKLGQISSTLVKGVLNSVPSAWGIRKPAIAALGDLIFDRARFLSDEIDKVVLPHCRMRDSEFSWEGGEENGGK
jgi:hypothetical protein